MQYAQRGGQMLVTSLLQRMSTTILQQCKLKPSLRVYRASNMKTRPQGQQTTYINAKDNAKNAKRMQNETGLNA